MTKNEQPAVFHIDLTGGNGTPFRFMYWPKEEVVRYYDRRHTMTPGEPGYGINHTNENGRCAGGVLDPGSFKPNAHHGIRGWHEVDAWDVDRATVCLVGAWIEHVWGSRSWA